MSEAEHYLRHELYERVKEDPHVFDFLLRGAMDGLWYWDLESPEHEWMSPEFWKLLGYDPRKQPHLVSAWQDLVNKEDLAVTLNKIERHCADASYPYDEVVRYRHADGSTVWVRSRGIAVRDKSGKAVRMLGAHMDVTRFKQLEVIEEVLEDRLKIMKASNEQLEEFAYVASHDLRAPLRRIMSFLALIEDELSLEPDSRASQWMASVNDNAEFMQKMMSDLLDLSRIAETRLAIERVDLNDCAQIALANLATKIEAWPGRVVIEPLPVVYGIDTLLTNLFQNLIQNAMIYCGDDDPFVKVYAETAGDHCMLKIEDNGIGIDAAHHEEVFEIFKRLHARQDYGGGTGMGLAISRRIVRRLGGNIAIESEPGVGTTVLITLPMHRVAEPSEEIE